MRAFLSQFTAEAEWYDHAFGLQCRGHSALAVFRTGWLRAIKDFRASIKSIELLTPTGGDGQGRGGAVIRCLYTGTMVGRVGKRPASGRSFAANTLIVLQIDERDGKISRVDEYYSATFDELGDVETYQIVAAPERAGHKL